MPAVDVDINLLYQKIHNITFQLLERSSPDKPENY